MPPYFRECFQHLYQVERKRIVTPQVVKLRLNRGERPTPLPEAIRAKIRINLQTRTIQQYPEYWPFYDRLARFIGFPKEQIVVGAGIEEFIRTLMFLCCDPGQKAAVLWPTCAMYDIYAKAFGVHLVRVATADLGGKLLVEDLLHGLSLHPGLRVLFIPNPGQPVPTCFSPNELGKIAWWCRERGIVLAIDEAHYGFGAPTAFPLVHAFDNVLVLRTFSKFFGAASIRVGYAVGQAAVIKPLEAVRPSGEVTAHSMLVAKILMDNIEMLEASAQATVEARDWLVNEIKTKLPAHAVYNSAGFSVLIDCGSAANAVDTAARLAAKGVYVKAGFPLPVESCMLVACGDKPLMQLFFTALEEVLA